MNLDHFFNLWDLYLRALTIFCITVCFETQAFDLYNSKNKFLSALNLSASREQEVAKRFHGFVI